MSESDEKSTWSRFNLFLRILDRGLFVSQMLSFIEFIGVIDSLEALENGGLIGKFGSSSGCNSVAISGQNV